MKKRIKKTNKISKGAPSGLAISVVLHIAAFLLAGLLVVFEAIKPEEVKFVPPKAVERPKMKLKKPKVRVKKSAKPKPTTRIVTKVQKANMPDIQLPEMSGMSEGLVGGIGGFEMSPDLSEMTVFGSGNTVGSDLVGTYYDFKRDRRGRPCTMVTDAHRALTYKFLKSGFRESTFSRYYRSPKKLYASCVVVPPINSYLASLAFGDAEAEGVFWSVVYRGKLVHKEEIMFRFWGSGDLLMVVRVNGKIVLASGWGSRDTNLSPPEEQMVGSLWGTDSSDSRKYVLGNTRAVVGDWITLEAGVPQDIEIYITDEGGKMGFLLAVQEKGIEYEKTRQGGPLLPAFKTARISRDLQDQIYRHLAPGELSITNGPVFSDFGSSTNGVNVAVTEPEMNVPEEIQPDQTSRIWNHSSGKTFEADFVSVIGDKVALKLSSGKTQKIPLADLSEEDIEFIELSRPPEFVIHFKKKCEQKTFSISKYASNRPPERHCSYGVSVKQRGTGKYNHEVNIEFFSIGQERIGNKYIILDHQTSSFVPSVENKRSHEFISSRNVILESYPAYTGESFGEDYAGYIVILTDVRGDVIEIDTSKKWLAENLETLRKRSVGNYIDKTCTRVFPTQPTTTYY